MLLDEDLRLLLEAVRVAKSALGLVRGNYAMIAAPNAAALVLSATGLLGPPGATLINNGTTIAAALNSLRPLVGG